METPPPCGLIHQNVFFYSICVAITAEEFFPLPFFSDVLARDRTGDTLTIDPWPKHQ